MNPRSTHILFLKGEWAGHIVRLVEHGDPALLWHYTVVLPDGRLLDAQGLARAGLDDLLMAIIEAIDLNDTMAA